MYINKIVNKIKGIDKKIMPIVKNGLKFSLVFCLIACYILVTYLSIGTVEIYYIGLSILKSGLFFAVGFIICGFAFNNILKEI